MIGIFPDPLPDELLYSVCARFHDRLQFPNRKSVLSELFGTTNSLAIIDLPCRISNLVASLMPSHSYTVDQIICDHTHLPFFGPFLPLERTIQLRDDMRGAGGLKVYRRSGVMASRIPTPERLRFCPLCKEEDRKKFGETYWHRLHQLPGILVCPKHNVFIEDTNARRNSARDCLRFVSAEDAVRPLPLRYLNSS